MESTAINGVWTEQVTEDVKMTVNTRTDTISVYIEGKKNPVKFEYPNEITIEDVRRVKARILKDFKKLEV